MRTLHVGLRVSDLEPSLAFYRAVGYTVTGTVEETPFGNLTMLQLPGDPFVTIELVHDPAKGTVDVGTGINHLVIQVESLDAALADLAGKGIAAEPQGLTGDSRRTVDELDHRPRRLSNRTGPVADRPRRRHHQSRLPRADGPEPRPTRQERTGSGKIEVTPSVTRLMRSSTERSRGRDRMHAHAAVGLFRRVTGHRTHGRCLRQSGERWSGKPDRWGHGSRA